MSGLGIAAGLATAALWTATSVCFESSSRRLGSFAVNVLRLFLACSLFLLLSLVREGTILPGHLTAAMWRDLTLSGLIGFVVGDVLLFEAFVLIGARLSMLIYASVPAMTAVAAFLCLGESIAPRALFGMGIAVLGIAMAIYGGGKAGIRVASLHRRRGVLCAIGGSAGQSVGLLLGKTGSVGVDSFAATEVRALAGLAGFVLLAALTRRVGGIAAVLVKALRPAARSNPVEREEAGHLRSALCIMACGSILGPFLGVSLGLKSLQLLPAGVASTLMSIVPALLIPVSAVVFRERVRGLELLGTATTLSGVAILSL